jgi:hypothetical protein
MKKQLKNQWIKPIMVMLIIFCLFNQFLSTLIVADFNSDATYKTEFNTSNNDNCTVQLNGWSETFVTGWDGTKAAYFNESRKGTDAVRLCLKTSTGVDITNTKGVYFEFKVPYNYTNNGAVWIYISFGSLQFGFRPDSTRLSCYTNFNGITRIWELGIYKQYLNRTYHRMFVHFNNITGLVTLGFDEKVFSYQIAPVGFPITSTNIFLETNGHPGIMIDNIKIFLNQTFPIDDYFVQYYPDFMVAFPPNNYDFAYSPILHADDMTYNMTTPIFNFYENYGISVGETYFYNNSVGVDTLKDNATMRNYALSKATKHGIYTHSLQKDTDLSTGKVLAMLNSWKNLMGSYPLISADHGNLQHNMARNGSNSTSPYYIDGLRNSSSLKYIWVNYENLHRLPIPEGYVYYQRNALLAFQLGKHGAVYSNSGINNLFSSGNRILYIDPDLPWYYFTMQLANDRGLALEHSYHSYYLFKNISGTKYTRLTPLPPGYAVWNSNWGNYYHDSTSPWTLIPEYIEVMNNITSHYTVHSDLTDKLLDRAVITNSSFVYKAGNTIYVNTPSALNNATIYTKLNMTKKALFRDDNYYPFTKGYYSWGATIPSNSGNNSYSLVDWNYSIDDTGQVGRLIFKSDGNVSIYFKKSGSLTFQLTSMPDPVNVTVKNITGGGIIAFSLSDDNITFIGKAGYEYLVEFVVNNAPVARDDTTTVAEDSTDNTIHVLVNDVDIDLDSLTITSVTDPSHGTATISGSDVLYTPTTNYHGLDSLNYTISDGNGGSDTAVVTVTITPVNDAPVVSGIPGQTINQGESFASFDLDNYVTDVDNTPAEITWGYSGETNLTIGIDSATHVVTITIPTDWYGAETITFTAMDPGLLSDSDAAMLTVKQYHSINVMINWNLISIPAYDTINKADIKVSYVGTIYSWADAVSNGIILDSIYTLQRGSSQAYETVDILIPGDGYWLWAYHECVLLIASNAHSPDPKHITDLQTKWNIIGLPYETPLNRIALDIVIGTTHYTWTNATTGSDPIILGFIYSWDISSQTYILQTTLEPDQGYWMYAYHDCKLYRGD